MWLSAMNHHAAASETQREYVTITEAMSDEIKVGMTMEEVVAILGKPTDTEVATSPHGNESVRAYWRATDRQSVYLRLIDGQVTDILSRP